MQRMGKIVLLPEGFQPPAQLSKKQQQATKKKQPVAKKGSKEAGAMTSSSGLDLTEVASEPIAVNLADLPLPRKLQDRLFDHQKIGVSWMYGLFLANSGGILGDDMGLGKTFQVTCFLSGLVKKRMIKRVLIIAPVSVLPSWERELVEHLQTNFRDTWIHLVGSDLPKKKRTQVLKDVVSNSTRERPRIVITSYHLVANMLDDFGNTDWDYVILDEGHIIKNPSTKLYAAMHALKSSYRLVLTGTPIQNNLNEFWAIADWATKGEVFGSLSSFKNNFALPILAGQDPKATDLQREASEAAVKRFMKLLRPILLQRKKCEQPSEHLRLPDKTELVVWIPLSSQQRGIYEEYVESRQLNSALQATTYPVAAINHLKTLCRHPILLEARDAAAAKLQQKKSRDDGGGGDDADDDLGELTSCLSSLNVDGQHTSGGGGGGGGRRDMNTSIADIEDDECWLSARPTGAKSAITAAAQNSNLFSLLGREANHHQLLAGSVKLRVLCKLLARLHRNGHRTLIFSQSRLMLDIIEDLVVKHLGLSLYRIDGSVPSKERQQIIDDFNDIEPEGSDCDEDDDADSDKSGSSPSVCLLTTRACGTGITLTGADRVIIFDPSWNPAEDRQAVDRAYRIGQKKNVVVYRFIMASSVEEKMYEKQVFKDGLRVVTESGSSSRYVSSHETRELFTLGPPGQSLIMERLWARLGEEIRSFPDTRGDLPSVLGFSRHDKLYAEERPDELREFTSSSSSSSGGKAGGVDGGKAGRDLSGEDHVQAIATSTTVPLSTTKAKRPRKKDIAAEAVITDLTSEHDCFPVGKGKANVITTKTDTKNRIDTSVAPAPPKYSTHIIDMTGDSDSETENESSNRVPTTATDNSGSRRSNNNNNNNNSNRSGAENQVNYFDDEAEEVDNYEEEEYNGEEEVEDGESIGSSHSSSRSIDDDEADSDDNDFIVADNSVIVLNDCGDDDDDDDEDDTSASDCSKYFNGEEQDSTTFGNVATGTSPTQDGTDNTTLSPQRTAVISLNDTTDNTNTDHINLSINEEKEFHTSTNIIIDLSESPPTRSAPRTITAAITTTTGNNNNNNKNGVSDDEFEWEEDVMPTAGKRTGLYRRVIDDDSSVDETPEKRNNSNISETVNNEVYEDDVDDNVPPVAENGNVTAGDVEVDVVDEAYFDVRCHYDDGDDDNDTDNNNNDDYYNNDAKVSTPVVGMDGSSDDGDDTNLAVEGFSPAAVRSNEEADISNSGDDSNNAALFDSPELRFRIPALQQLGSINPTANSHSYKHLHDNNHQQLSTSTPTIGAATPATSDEVKEKLSDKSLYGPFSQDDADAHVLLASNLSDANDANAILNASITATAQADTDAFSAPSLFHSPLPPPHHSPCCSPSNRPPTVARNSACMSSTTTITSASSTRTPDETESAAVPANVDGCADLFTALSIKTIESKLSPLSAVEAATVTSNELTVSSTNTSGNAGISRSSSSSSNNNNEDINMKLQSPCSDSLSAGSSNEVPANPNLLYFATVKISALPAEESGKKPLSESESLYFTKHNSELLQRLGLFDNQYSPPCLRPLHSLFQEERDQYNTLLLQAAAVEAKLLLMQTSSTSPLVDTQTKGIVEVVNTAEILLLQVTQYYLSALEICDEDVSLHGKLAYLQQCMLHSDNIALLHEF